MKGSQSSNLICAVRPIQLSIVLNHSYSVHDHLLVLYLEVNVHSEEHSRFQLIEQGPRHLDVLVATVSVACIGVGQCFFADLDAR